MTAYAKTAHTGTPWIVKTLANGRLRIGNPSGVGPCAIADILENNGTTDIANAAFLVRACNAHETLVETLTNMDKWLANTHHATDHPWRISIRAALALARGEA